jgi:hypothetical protein
MNLQTFVEKYKGRKVDFDGALGAQCVDLARQYFKDVWELPEQPEGVIGAADFALKREQRPIQRKHTSFTPVIPEQPIPAGAVVIMNPWPENKFGHIGICTACDGNEVTLFNQDGFAQDGAKFTRWRYDSRVAGYLTKKEG